MPPNPDIISAALKTATSFVFNAVEVLRFGGLQTDEEQSPFEIVSRRPMFRLRRYYPPAAGPSGDGGVGISEDGTPRPPIVLVPPMMISAEVWDVSPSTSAVAALHEAGMDPWVVDFGAPDLETGGLERTLTDHVVAVSDAVDLVTAATGRSVHLGGYSQGGMFCYQAAAYRRSRDLESIVTFGAPVDWRGNAPLGIPEQVVVTIARLVADYVFNERPLPGWLASTAFRLLDPIKTARSQVDFLRQLHNRDALLGHERQRRFIGDEGFVAWSGPALVDMLQQVIVQNRMMVGGFVVGDHVVSLADITCPVLAVFGEVDEIGVPAGVRKIASVAPAADVYDFSVRAGHFGLVVGSTAASLTWPTVASWIDWIEDRGTRPDGITEVDPDTVIDSSPTKAIMLAADGAFQAAGLGVGVVRGAGQHALGALRTTRAVGYEAVRAAPRLIRLGQIQPATRISFAKIIEERARNQPNDACFLFSDRVHTYSAVDTRITNVVKGLITVGVRQGDHVGVVMETRPSALVAIAALSRLGAVAVLLPPSQSLPELLQLSSVTDVVADPEHASKVTDSGARALVLGGGGGERDLPADLGEDVVDLERIDPEAVELPRWYRPNPGRGGDLAFVFFTRSTGTWQTKLVTNHRWAASAFGTASAARLTTESTVYCLSPLHHPSGLLTTVGGAVAGGARIALSRGFDPATFDEEIRRYGVTVVSYTWAMMRELVRGPVHPRETLPTLSLFMCQACPVGCGGGSWTATRARGSLSSMPVPSPMWSWPTSPPPSRARADVHCPAPPTCVSSRSIPTPARSSPAPMASPYPVRSTHPAYFSPGPGSDWTLPCANSVGCSAPATRGCRPMTSLSVTGTGTSGCSAQRARSSTPSMVPSTRSRSPMHSRSPSPRWTYGAQIRLPRPTSVARWPRSRPPDNRTSSTSSKTFG